MTPRLSRRTFVRTAAVAAPYLLAPRRALAADPKLAPGNRIGVGIIGVGGRGGYHLKAMLDHPGVQVVAVCDANLTRREAARERTSEKYAEAEKSGQYKGCASVQDFRELIARGDVDAVIIATPDHWHALAAIMAMKAGKDVYCEKPVSLTVAEGREVVSAAQRFGRILQVGSQERSNPRGRYACELVRNGRIGRLKTITIGLPVDARDCGLQPEQPIPPDLDYNLWLGPAPYAPYTKVRVSGNFRYIYDYSGGEMTDRGAHVADIALWGAQPWLKGPVAIEPKNAAFYTNSLYNTAIRYHITFTYASGLQIIVQHDRARGIRFEGERGWIEVAIHGCATTASDPAILTSTIGPDEVHLHESPGHHDDFLHAVRTRGDVVAPPEEGHRTATFCHLCNLSLILGRTLTWDPQTEQFVHDPEADRMLSRPMRVPWRLV
ncbi:MAG: Gfo/Idh/MocA family oxidoreductase [Tepidisphaeraceae bacterium]